MTDNLITLPVELDLTGRIVGLNREKCQRFQCPGFVLSQTIPYQLVPAVKELNPSVHKAMLAGIRQGLFDGRLLDVTDVINTPAWNKTGLRYKDSEASAVSAEDIGKPKVIMGTDRKGRIYVITPRDKEHEAELINELKTTGNISSVQFEEASGVPDAAPGLSRIKIEELPPQPKIILTDE